MIGVDYEHREIVQLALSTIRTMRNVSILTSADRIVLLASPKKNMANEWCASTRLAHTGVPSVSQAIDGTILVKSVSISTNAKTCNTIHVSMIKAV